MLYTAIKVCVVIYAILKLIRWYLQRTWGSVDKNNEISAKGKVVLITGANAGIGRATAMEFACRDAIVILACRDMNRAEDAVNWIRTKTSLGQLICTKLDLASLESIRKFCKDFQAKYDKIDILVNNAGLFLPPEEKRKTVEGFEMHMGVNHLGHFLLTNLLMEPLKKAAPSRIVNVSSMAHSFVTFDLDDIMSEKDTFDTRFLVPNLYSRSKLANMLFNKELAKRLEGSGVRTYALCPGGVTTEIGQTMKGAAWLILRSLSPIMQFLMKTPEEGAATTMYCALSKNLISESGEVYRNCEFWNPKDRAVLKDADAKKLWDVSSKLVGLKSE